MNNESGELERNDRIFFWGIILAVSLVMGWIIYDVYFKPYEFSYNSVEGHRSCVSDGLGGC